MHVTSQMLNIVKRKTHALTRVLFLASCLSFIPIGQAAAPTGHQFIVGVSAHPFRKGRNYRAVIDAIAAAGATSIRFDVRWPRIEKKKGHLAIPKRLDDLVNYANTKHVRALLILDTRNPHYENRHKPTTKEAIAAFANFAHYVAVHFKGRVDMYEVWNEWNLTIHGRGGTAKQYTALLRPTYRAIKSVSKDIIVLGGSLTPNGMSGHYLKRLVSLGALNYMDGLAIHPYNYCSKKRGINDWKQSLQKVEERIQQATGKTTPLYVTEMGIPTSTGRCGASLDMQASTVYQTITTAASIPYIAGIWWYDLYDNAGRADKHNNRFGLMSSDGQPKPGYHELRRAIIAVNKKSH